MGFFKKIGTAIKKNVSFKNLVKIATPVMGAIPFVGGFAQNTVEGLSAAHEAKKQATAQNNAQALSDAEAMKQATLAYAGQNIGAIAGAGANMFAKGITEGAYNGASKGFTDGLGTVGASVADSTIKAWFTLHWKHILIWLGVVGGSIWLIRSQMHRNPRRRAKPAYRR